jgi:hypothetical protein
VNPSSTLVGLTDLTAIFSNMSTINSKSDVIISRLDLMQPAVITESISFLIGAFVAIAFVLSSKVRY